MSPSMLLLLVIFLAFASTVEIANAKAFALKSQQRIKPTATVASVEPQDRLEQAGAAPIGSNATQSYALNGRSATQSTKGPIIINSEFTKKSSLLGTSLRYPSLPRRKVNGAVTKDATTSGVGVFVDHTSSESQTTTDVRIDNINNNNDNAGKTSGGSSDKARPALTEAHEESEENEVLSPKEMSELKPKEKKLRAQQHQRGVHRALAEEEFDFEHYFDKIPSYDYNENSDRDTRVRSEEFGGF